MFTYFFLWPKAEGQRGPWPNPHPPPKKNTPLTAAMFALLGVPRVDEAVLGGKSPAGKGVDSFSFTLCKVRHVTVSSKPDYRLLLYEHALQPFIHYLKLLLQI